MTCDASGGGAGAVLTQQQGAEEKVIAYAGTSFNEAQQKYSPTDRELAAIRFAVNHFKHYLYGHRFIIRTDHQPLLYLHRMKRFDNRLHRTMEDLNIGQYELEYLPGKSNTVADALSRAAYPWKLPDDPDSRVCWESEQQIEDFESVPIKGGADSFYRALSYVLHGNCDLSDEIRQSIVDRIAKKPSKYGYVDSGTGRKLIELLRDAETFPPMDILQAAVDSLGLRLIVHFVNGPVIHYQSNTTSERVTVHLSCSGGVHFDALVDKLVIGIKQIQETPVQDLNVQPIHLESSVEELKQWQTRDDDIAELVRKVRASARGQVIELGDGLKCFKQKFQKLSIKDGLLVFECSTGRLVPVVPEGSVRGLAEDLHSVLSHAGRDKTLAVMSTKFHHPKFQATITKVVQECTVCQAHKGKIDRKYPIYRRQVKEPYQILAVDLMELPFSKRHYKCVLVCLDLCTKYAHVVPLKSKKSDVVSRALESRVLASVPQTPKIILSDNGSEFRGKPFEALLQRYGIAHEYSVPYVAATNGGVERFNQTLRSRLAAVSHGDTRGWDKHLYSVVSQYNRTPHTETGRAPCEFFVKEAKINVPHQPYWKPPKNFKPFKVGDLVLRKVPYQPAGERDKLAPRFEGPLKIVEADSNGVVYKAQWLAAPHKIIQLHISQIKRYHGHIPSPSESEQLAIAEPVVQNSVEGPQKNSLDLNWDNLLLFSASKEVQQPVGLAMGGNEQNQAEEAGNNSSVLSNLSSIPNLNRIPSPGAILPDEYDSDIGSWQVSPLAEDVISDNCEVIVPASTPRRRAPPPPRNPPFRQIEVPEPGSSTLGRTRQQTRCMQQQAIADEVANRPRSSSSSDPFFSDESVMRGEHFRELKMLGSFVPAHSIIGADSPNSNIIIINNTQDNLHLTIEDPSNFHSLITIKRDDFRWSAQDPGDTLPD